MSKKVRIGVFGVGRGSTFTNYCLHADHAELVAMCDKNEALLNSKKEKYGDIAYYTSFDEFIEHDMDAVVLANYATEHAPFAIRCLEKGLHVMSEVLPIQTMQQAVELIEAVERTGKIYMYAENYCYMPAPYEMRRLYKEGKLGEFEYGEGEYMHNCESIWSGITHGNDPTHWRNTMHAMYYCTHSFGPLIHITGLRPVKVVGLEVPQNAKMARCGAGTGPIALEMVTLENGAIVKSLHGVGCARNSVWYSVYGSKGRCESAREDAHNGDVGIIHANLDNDEGKEVGVNTYNPINALSESANGAGHGGGDFYTMYNFCEKILGNENTDCIDVYEAMDMFLPGLFAHRSALNGGITMDIPNLRNKEEREKYRNDVACVDPAVAGDQVLPATSKPLYKG